MLGPFASINYGPNLKFKNYNHILSYGIRYNLRHMYDSKEGLYFLNIETGIKAIDNHHHLYFNIGTDLIWIVSVALIPIALSAL